MDTSDNGIVFNEKGICDHCENFRRHVYPHWYPNEEGRKRLSRIAAEIKKSAIGNPFDCIIGVSGGVDSSYLLHMVVTEYGLRPLVFHVDGGWNSDLAVHNIQVLIDKLGLDLYTEVINWEEMRDFQLSFFKSGVPHLDVPQDHAFIATLYRFADKYNIKCILNGGNYATECVRNPLQWLYYGTDMRHLRDIHKRFGSVQLSTFPFSPILYHKLYLRYFRGVRVLKPLNFMPYSKSAAINTLEKTYGWKPYAQKHFESRFTRFYESYWLPTRFGYDTRKVQYSSLILTEQMTRNEALELLKKPAYDPDTIDADFEYISSKLNISVNELRDYHRMPLKCYNDYANSEWMFHLGANILKIVGVERAIKR